MASTVTMVVPPLQCSPLSWTASFQGSASLHARVSLTSTRPTHGARSWAVNSAENRNDQQSSGRSTPLAARSSSSPPEAAERPVPTNWREAWKLAPGESQNHWRLRRGERPPLSDDGARRVIKEREAYERALRKTTGAAEAAHKAPRKWISRTPEQMSVFMADNKWQWRWKRRYSRSVEGAIAAVRGTSSVPPQDVDMRQVMKPFAKELGFRDLCIILKNQRSWRTATLFFAWMKLQIPYSPSLIAYTILLQIYGQSGKLSLAESTLAEILSVSLEPDAVAAGVLLESYCRWDRHDTMLEFYEAVRQRGLVPPAHVYRGMMVGLYRAARFSDVVLLWEDFLVEKLQPNFAMYAIMVHVLSKEGRLEEAVLTFADMRRGGHLPDEMLWNTVISVLGKLGRYQDAEAQFVEMKKQGVAPSKYTFTTMINVWSKAGRYASAAETLSEMQKMGCPPDEFVYCSIINMYGKAGWHEEAEKVFREISERGILSHEKTYTCMANVRADAGRYAEALELFDAMAEKGILTTRMAWNTLLRCFVGAGDVAQATKVYGDMVEAGSANVVTYGNMINLYSQFQMVAQADELQAEMREAGVNPDAHIYGSLVKLYCKSDMIGKAVLAVQEMTDQGLVPDQIVKTNLMQAYGSVGRYDEAVELFQSLQDPDMVAVSSILGMQDTEEGRENASLSQSLQGLPAPVCIPLLNQLLIRRAEAGEVREAGLLHDKVLELGGCLSDKAAALMIDLLGRRGSFSKARSVFLSLERREHPPSLYVHNTMLKICVACEELDQALSMLDQMEETGPSFDAVSTSILVSACTKAGRHKDAADVMMRARKAGVAMDTVAYNTMIKANLKSGNLKRALAIYTEMRESHVEPTVQTYSILIGLFSKLGDLEKALQAFEVLLSSEQGADEIAYSQMIHCYGSAGRPQEAANLFREMERSGHKPNEVHYNNLVGAFAGAGLFTPARRLLLDMRSNNCPPSRTTFLLLLSAYGLHRRPADAEALLLLMLASPPHPQPDARHYQRVILAYARVGRLRDAHRVFALFKDHQPSKAPAPATAESLDPTGCLRTLLRGYVEHGELDRGWEVFQEERTSWGALDQRLYAAALDLCAGRGREEEAAQLLEEAHRDGFRFAGPGPSRPTRTAWRRPGVGGRIWRRSSDCAAGGDVSEAAEGSSNSS